MMVLLGSVTLACGQTAPPFRSIAPLQLVEQNAGSAETSPAGAAPGELFGMVPAFGGQLPPMPAVPRGELRLPRLVQPIPGPGTPVPATVTAAQISMNGGMQRLHEVPITLQRHPVRNLDLLSRDSAFTFRAPAAADIEAQLIIGMQAETWHTDNLAFTKRSVAVEDVIMELRPVVQLNLGSLPEGTMADSLRSEYYLQVRYMPTQHTLLETGTSRLLQRVEGEIGRVGPILSAAVRFEYDENIFGSRGSGTVEESSTVTEISPLVAYNLNAKTVLRVEGAWRRLVLQGSVADRSEYVLETGFTTELSPKTVVGAGMAFGHIPFDQARFGVQNYEQAFATTVWRPAPKIRFQTRAGVELRQFDGAAPKPARVTPVVSMSLNWLPTENSQLNAGFLVRNQPSVSKIGATFQEIRFGADGRYQIGRNYYVSGELALLQRNYDTGIRELEGIIRPAAGYRADKGRLFDALNVEIYYQFRHLDSNQRGGNRDRSVFGIESTLSF